MTFLLSIFQNPLKYICIGLVLTSLLLWGQVRTLKADVTILEANAVQLHSAISTQDLTIDYLHKEKESLSLNVQSLVLSHSEISNSLFKSLDEISQLRATEAKHAIEKPFERGNAASSRINDILLSIGQTSDSAGTN